MARESKATAIERIMKGLKCSREEAEEVYKYDNAVDHDEKTDFDLPPDKLAIARKQAHTGTRKVTAYKFEKKERKANTTKEGVIAAIADFLDKNSELSISDVQIVNKEREILMKVNDEWYSVTLIYKRNMNKK